MKAKRKFGQVRFTPSRVKRGGLSSEQVYEISRPDFVREVSEASKTDWVIVLLYKDT